MEVFKERLAAQHSMSFLRHLADKQQRQRQTVYVSTVISLGTLGAGAATSLSSSSFIPPRIIEGGTSARSSGGLVKAKNFSSCHWPAVMYLPSLSVNMVESSARRKYAIE